MKLEQNASFPSIEQWRDALQTREPQQLRAALFALAQVLPWSRDEDRAGLRSRALQHRAQRDPRLAAAWIEGLFRVGGDEVEGALRDHALGNDGSAESRALAAARARELQAEVATRAALAAARPAAADRDRLLELPLHAGFGDGIDDVAELTLTPGDLERQLRALCSPTQRALLLAAGFAPALATDCDGTTWKHDIGEALFARAIELRRLLPAAGAKLRATLERYRLTPSGEVNDDAAQLKRAFDSGALDASGAAHGLSRRQVCAEYYAANLWCFAGHTVASMKAWGRELFEGSSGFEGKVFDGLSELLASARELGLIPYAISASNQWIVEIGAEYLGIPPWRVAGVRARVEDGVITTEIEAPLTYGAGKVDAIRALAGGAPAMAMGDSVDATDRELLESALLKIAVEPKPSRLGFVLARGRDNWRLLDFERTEDGEAADTLTV